MKRASKLWELESEDLSNLGGPMGSEYTTTNWRKFFPTQLSARRFAEADYLKETDSPSPIVWSRRRGGVSSQDLLFVMYHIRPVKVQGRRK